MEKSKSPDKRMARIEIKKLQEFPESKFVVTISSQATTSHTVTVTKEYYTKLTDGKISPEVFIEKSFEFLLAREPNTSILSAFDLPLISKYFPEYEEEITK